METQRSFEMDRYGPDASRYAAEADEHLVSARLLLNRFIANPPEGSVVWNITPAMARAMLERNTDNRTYRDHYALKLAGHMKRGEWDLNGQGIIFSDNGLLNDGQHRLSAILKSGVTVRMDVRFGIERSAFLTTDQGIRKNNGDMLRAMLGEKNCKNLAASLRWGSIIRGGGLPGSIGNSPSAQEIVDLVDQFPGMQHSMSVVRAVAAKYKVSAGMLAALHHEAAVIDPKAADEFFKVMTDGIGFTGKGDAALALQRRLTTELGGQSRLKTAELLALFIKAMRYRRIGKHTEKLLWAREKNEPFPEL